MQLPISCAKTALSAGLIALAGMTSAEAPAPGDTAATYDVRLIGVKVGTMTLAGRISDSNYVIASGFSTSGVAGQVARASFDLKSSGRTHAGGFIPARYDEAIDTGRRQSSARLRYRSGVPRITGGTLAQATPDPGEVPLDPGKMGGTLDPLTAMFAAMHDQPATALCKVDVTVFDGARKSSIRMTGRVDAGGGAVICDGVYTRLEGFSQSELDRQTVFPFSVEYAPAGDMMQTQRVTMRSSLGKAELLRR